MLRALIRYGTATAALLVVYAVTAGVLWSGKDFTERGPLSRFAPPVTESIPGDLPLAQIVNRCFPDDTGLRPDLI